MKWGRIAALAAFFGSSTLQAAEVDLSTGYRNGNLNWYIGVHDIDVLSELTWKNLNIWNGQVHFRNYFPRRWECEGLVNVGFILSGRNRDSDYATNGRQDEFSLSTSDVKGYVTDMKLALGRWFPRKRAVLVPQVGVSWNRQYVSGSNAVIVKSYEVTDNDQIAVSFINQPFGDGQVVATYQADWLTAFIGCRLRSPWTARLAGQAALRLHLGGYFGQGDWKFRELIFYHRAPASGVSAEASFFYRACRNLEFFLTIEEAAWIAFDGVESNRQYGNGNTIKMRDIHFSEATWYSIGVRLGLIKRF